MKIAVIILFFLYIFNPPLIVFGNFSNFLNLAGLVFSTAYFLFFKNKLYLHRPTVFLFCFLFFDFFISFLLPFISGTSDYDILTTKVNIIVSLVVCYFFVAILVDHGWSQKNFLNVFFWILLLQSLIIVGMLLNQSFFDLIFYATKTENAAERMLQYSGARGLGLTSFAAFGLSVTMAVLAFFSLYAYRKDCVSTPLFWCGLPFMIIGAFSAGRVSALGFILGALYFFLTARSIVKIYCMVGAAILMVGILFLVSIDLNAIEIVSIRSLLSYALEPIRNYIEGYGFSSKSTDALINMYFPLSFDQLFFGDAKYMTESGYYMSTDAGYMRFALFYGIWLSLFFYCSFAIYVGYYCSTKDIDPVFFVALLMLAFMLHYKGEVVLFSIPFNKIVFVFLFSLALFKRKS